jgi:hypothetical protein
MKLGRWDFAVVGAVAVLSTVVFTGLGGGQAGAEGQKPPEVLHLTLAGSAEAELGGCRVAASAEGTPTADADAVLLVSVRNPGAETATLNFKLVIRKQEMSAASRMSRSISPADFVYTKVAERSLALKVDAGATAQTRAAFRLPAGSYAVSTLDAAGKNTGLCMLRVATAKLQVVTQDSK